MSHRRRSNATGPPPPEGVGDSSTAQASSTEKERPDPPSVLGLERRVLALALAFRAANALLVRTYFNPDEHWQCLEVAHRIVFGNVIINVALWGERATSFPAEKIINASKEEPQIVIFVGTLVRGYVRNVSLSGNSACKWFINIDAPEVNSFRASIQGKNEPIQFTDIPAPSAVVGPEKKTVAEIKELHPFKFKKHEFQVTVVIKKLCTESSWWYTACDTCKKTARPHGNAYRCPDPTCPPIVSASPRYKLNLIAGDDTAETTFILFGRLAQRLIGRSADVLLQENQTEKGCIPSAVTDLLEKQFVWNVSITENTVATGNVSFQVNRIVGGAPGHALALLQSPSGSQASSLLPTMALSPTTSCDQSSALPSALDTPSVDINDAQLALTSPAITPIQATEEEETDQDDDHLPLTQKATAVTTRNSASKAYKKRPRPSPGIGAAKKLFKDADDKDAGGSDAPVA